ncbi:MAG: PRC-barrel domain-containing protein [Desulfitobacteriaceae bacterium]|nr:PRC-barrel domain-containing protein [Desulfitobacteriaceae bacterium]MDD4751825.1 PRC-barrel domain-containing protein [Desulfitobacteriaceae bacterium]
MHFSKEIRDLPTISLVDGIELGRVVDLIVDLVCGRVCGLVLENKNFFQNGKFIELEDVINIGRDAVTVNSKEVIQDDPEKQKGNLSWLSRVEENVYSTGGTDLGVIKDIIFNFPDGCITGIELSGGLWADLNQGRKMVLWESVVQGNGSNLIVDSSQENIWQ